MLVGFASLFSPTVYVAEAESEPPPEPRTVLIEIRKEIPATLLRIADCESGERDKDGRAIGGSATHYDKNGDVLIGQHTDPKYGKDVGKFQINTLYHEARAKEMGLDIYNEYDNEKYALVLFEENGTRDWNASRSCWQD